MITDTTCEFTMNTNDYNEQDTKTGKNAVIQNIINIIFGDEYIIPSIPKQTGLFIQQYRFEFIDVAIQKIQSKLIELINDNIPGNLIKDVIVVQKDKYTIGIGLEFMNDRINDLENAETVKELERRIAILQIRESGSGYQINLLR